MPPADAHEHERAGGVARRVPGHERAAIAAIPATAIAAASASRRRQTCAAAAAASPSAAIQSALRRSDARMRAADMC
jgi:hypothetical protein